MWSWKADEVLLLSFPSNPQELLQQLVDALSQTTDINVIGIRADPAAYVARSTGNRGIR